MTDILLEKEWLELLNQEFHKEYMRRLRGVLVDCANQKISICPHPKNIFRALNLTCLLYTSPSPRDDGVSRMPSSA